jgi:hypothetical protein
MVNQAGKQMNDAGRGEFFAGKSFSMEEGIIKSAYFLEFPSITTLKLPEPGCRLAFSAMRSSLRDRYADRS